jgi:hypothetical protein
MEFNRKDLEKVLSLDDESFKDLTRIIAEAAGASKAKTEMMLSNPELLKKRISGMNESEALSLIQSAGKDKSEAIMQMLRQRGVDLGQ